MRIRKLFGVSLGLWLLVAAPGSAPAGLTPVVINVTNGNDSGPGSLRDAIQQANSFYSGHYGEQPVIRNATGHLTIILESPLPAIVYPTFFLGGAGITINGANITGPGLVVNADLVHIHDLTVEGCHGDGIQVNGGNFVWLVDCSAFGNTGNGITVQAGFDDSAVDCKAKFNGGKGIQVIGGSGHEISGATLANNGDDGLNVGGATGITIGTDVIPVVGDLGGPVDEILGGPVAEPMHVHRLAASRAPTVTTGPPGTGTVTCVINNNGGYGINLANCVNVTVRGCYIGTDSSGTNSQPNAAGGILVTDSTGTHVSRCLVSGNGTNWAPGVTLYSTQNPSTSLSNSVTACYIGTDITGTKLVPNSGYGVYLYNAADNFIGPTPTALSGVMPTAGANVIAGNKYTEVNIGGPNATGNYVQGNIIGLDGTATVPLDLGVGGVAVLSPGNLVDGNLIGTSATGVNISGNNNAVHNNRIRVTGNSNYGISLSDANNCLVGGPDWGDGNLITCDVNNSGSAVWVYQIGVPGFAATNNSIRGNATFGPILLDNARNANVPCSSTNGANFHMNYPVLTAADTSGSGTTIQGTLNSQATTTYSVDFYANTNSNPLSPAGQYYLGTTPVTTDGGCTGSFQFVVNTPAPVPAGQFITATATDPNGNTSEFSNQRAVTGTATAADVSLTASATPVPVEPGGPITYSLVLSNAGPATAGPVTVTDWLPAAVTFDSCNATGGGVCGGSGNSRTVAFSALASGASATITFVATVSGALANGTEIDNFATASLPTPDPNPANNTAVAVAFAERQADLRVTKTATPEPVDTGAALTYSLVVSNQGPDTATGVQLIDLLPVFEVFVTATASQGSCTQLGNVVSCSLANLAAGASATVTLTVLPYLSGLITNPAVVVANELDPNLSNNTAIAISTVLTDTVATAAITVVANPSNGGTVSGGGTYPVGSSQSISATASNGWTFISWNDGNTQNPRTITVPTTNITYTATFSPPTQQSIATPVITPPGGTFSNSALVTLSCATTGATIHYTADGTDPTSTSPAYKKKALTLTNSVSLKAKAVKGTNTSTTATAVFTIIVPPPPTIATTNLTNATAKQSYTATLHITPGTGVAPFKWSLLPGSKLPAGLTLKATTGVISGKPAKPTVTPASFTVHVTDARKRTATQLLTLTITN